MRPFPPPRNPYVPLHRTPPRQRGAALTIGLILLVLLTLIGVTTMRSSSLETSMSGHATDCNLAFQAAEAALREAELFLENTADTVYGLHRHPGYYRGASHTPRWEDPNIWAVNSTDSAMYAGTPLTGVARQPRYIIEALGSLNIIDMHVHRCSASGDDGFVMRDCGDYFVNLDVAERNLHTRDGAILTRLYRITAQGYGAQTDDNGNPVSVVMVQSTFRP